MKIFHPSLLAVALILTPALTTSFNPAFAKDNSATSPQSANTRLSVNKASAEQLSAIKGLGMKKATAIVDYREMNGPFKAVAELTNVKGIGDKFIEKNAQHLSL